MTRLVLAVAVYVVGAAEASAIVTPVRPFLRLGEDAVTRRLNVQPAPLARPRTAAISDTPFTLTDRSEVLLDGKPCRYEDVPAHASIILLELAADRQTVLRIHFRSRK